MPARSPRALRKTSEVHPPVSFSLETRRNFMKSNQILGNVQKFLGIRGNHLELDDLSWDFEGITSKCVGAAVVGCQTRGHIAETPSES